MGNHANLGLKVSFILFYLVLSSFISFYLTFYRFISSVLFVFRSVFIVFALAFYVFGVLIIISSSARSANYGDDMGEFNGMGRGGGRVLSNAWALYKMNM